MTESRSTCRCAGSTRTPATTRRSPVATTAAVRAALTEWAPGATFYAQAAAVRIDAVDVGSDLDGTAADLADLPHLRLVAAAPRLRRPGTATPGNLPPLR